MAGQTFWGVQEQVDGEWWWHTARAGRCFLFTFKIHAQLEKRHRRESDNVRRPRRVRKVVLEVDQDGN